MGYYNYEFTIIMGFQRVDNPLAGCRDSVPDGVTGQSPAKTA